jgi:hypothetical protein
MNRGPVRERWALPLIGLVGLGVGLLIGVVATGDGDTKTTTTTVVSTTSTGGAQKTRTIRRRGRTRTVVRTRTVTVAGGGGGGGGSPVAVPGGGRAFSGRGAKTIGTLRVPKKSTILWTNKGDVFTLLSERQIHVSSSKSSGTATLERGTYTNFRVAAIGRWTMRIIPR